MSRIIRNIVLSLLALILMLALATFPAANSSIIVGMPTSAELQFATMDITINRQRLDNYMLFKSVMGYQHRTYLPATEEMLSALGLEMKITEPDEKYAFGLIEFKKTDPKQISEQGYLSNNLEGTSAVTRPGYMVCFVSDYASETGNDLRDDFTRSMYDAGLFFADLLGLDKPLSGTKIISLGGEEIYYAQNDAMYLPLAYFTDNACFGISAFYDYDSGTGLYISSNVQVDASETFSENNAAFITTVAEYIRNFNKDLSLSEAIYYEYLFRHEATVHHIDELLLLGVAKVESNFRMDSKGNGTIGVMQVLKKYGPNYGYSAEMLAQPHYNIELGAMYLRDRLATFKNNEIKALTAYNRGVSAVLSGNYSTLYAEKVRTSKKAIQKKLSDAGVSEILD